LLLNHASQTRRARAKQNILGDLMKIAFLGVRVPGHLNPTTTLGRQLQARNHEIIFPYSSGAGGLPFISGLEKDHVNRWR
jgi:hypothetical protein